MKQLQFIIAALLLNMAMGWSQVAATDAGTTPGTLEVSQTGAATYAIPIEVPPGAKGVAPNLALTYSSQAGNGLAGWGWNISGLSSITRVTATHHHDGGVDAVDFDALDRFALDGQRLVAVSGTYGASGTIYATERYSNLKIYGYGTSSHGSGPRYFLVIYPDGSRAWYGETSDSNGKLEWAINKWLDPQGNALHYKYIKKGNLLKISEIGYGRRYDEAPLNKVKFFYKSATPSSSYFGGTHFIRDEIVERIEVYYGSTKLRNYQLGHDDNYLSYPRLEYVQEHNRHNGTLEPIRFDYQQSPGAGGTNLANRLLHYSDQSIDVDAETHGILSGDFNGDGRMDVVTYDRAAKNKVNFYRNLHTGNLSSTEKSVVFDAAVSGIILDANNKVMPQHGITFISDRYYSGSNSTVSFKTYTGNGSGLGSQYTKSFDFPAYRLDSRTCGGTQRYKTPKKYISGDFNGDGLMDIIALTFPYTERFCNPTDDCSGPEPIARMATGECCECTDYIRSHSKSYFVDMDRRKTSGFVNYSGLVNLAIKYTDRIFPGDLDGDGKNELFIVTKGKVSVYGLDSSKILQKITEYVDDANSNESVIQTDQQFLTGDFNGDGKTDLLFPKEEYSKEWRMVASNGTSFTSYVKDIGVLYRKSKVYTAYTLEENYIAQDFNGDGKTDILNHEIGHANPGYNFAESERLDLFFNQTLSDGSSGFTQVVDKEYNGHGRDSFGIPIIFEANEGNPHLEYGFIADNKISAWEFTYDNRISTSLEKVTNNGVATTISYDDVTDGAVGDQNATYRNDNLEAYPYANIEHARGLRVVRQLQETGAGITRKMDFQYQTAVSHMQGLGFMGFSFLRRSNWYGTNVPQLWEHFKHDIKKRGALMEQWTADFKSTAEYNSASHVKYEYTTLLTSDKVFVNVPKKVHTWDKLKGLYTLATTTSYDTHYNPLKVVTSNSAGSVTEEYQYYNNTSPNNNTYHVGRLKYKKVTSKLNNNTFVTEGSYLYNNNLVREYKKRANGSMTNWVFEKYSNFDQWGNARTKEISGTNVPTRTETYVFDATGRFMEKKTGVDGLSSSYQYYPETGNIKQVTDVHGLVVKYKYDGWNRLKEETDYLGKTVLYTYTKLSGGGVKKYVNYPQGTDQVMEYNALGWLIKSRTLALGGKWIQKSYKYDVAGRKTHESEPYFSTASPTQWNQTVYNVFGQVDELRHFTGKVTDFEYDGRTTVTRENGRTVRTTLDGAGNISKVNDNGGTITYTYYGNGSLWTTSYGEQTITNYLDGWGRRKKMEDPSAGIYTYQYNDYGELLKEITPKGTTTYTYHNDGKIKTKKIKGDATDLSLDYFYNSDQLLDRISGKDVLEGNRAYTYNYTYDPYKRPKKVTETNGLASFEKSLSYDGYGRVEYGTFVSSASGTSSTVRTKNVYDGTTGILKEIRNADNSNLLWQLNEHDHRGQVKKVTLGNGFVKNRAYDVHGLPNLVTDSKGSGTSIKYALRMDYDFNAKKGILDRRKNMALSWNEDFQHDDLQRLTHVNGPAPRVHTYDGMGRIGNNDLLGSYAYHNSKKYQIASMGLNPKGQAHFKGHEVQQITYNAFKMPVEVNEPNKGRVSFIYGPMGNRARAHYGGQQSDRVQRRYTKHYSAISPVEITEDRQTGNVKIVTYLAGDAYSAPMVHIKTKKNDVSGFHYLHRDYLGSILAITDASGNVREQRQFGAWGTVDKFIDSGSGNAFGHGSILDRGYTGHEHFFEVSLIHMNGRMYDAVMGRFLSPDNFVQDPYNTQNFNRYSYVMNNPLVYNDPSGEFAWAAVIIGAAIGMISSAIRGGGMGDVLLGGLIGAAAGFVGAGVANIAAGGTFMGATLTTTGFSAGFTSGFVGGFAAGFTDSALTSWTKGESFGTGFGNGIRSGFIGGYVGGIINGITSGFRGVKRGESFWNGPKSPITTPNSDIAASVDLSKKTAATVEVEGDYFSWTDTAPGPDGGSVYRKGRFTGEYTYRYTVKSIDWETTLRVNGAEYGRAMQYIGDGMQYAGYGLTLTGVGAPIGAKLYTIGNGVSFGGSLLESAATTNWSQGTTSAGFFMADAAVQYGIKKIPYQSVLTTQILKQNAGLKIKLVEKLITN